MADEILHDLLRNLVERVERLEAKLNHPALMKPMKPRVVEGLPRYYAQPDRASGERWEDRLTSVPCVSEHSLVVEGTFVTVEHVVSLIVDGWTWSDIIRAHPDLTEDDIRACLAYNFTMHSG
jgi:uncharacterized protein (DUF433 family)